MRRPKGKPFCVVLANGRRRWYSSLREACRVAGDRPVEAYPRMGYWYFGDAAAVVRALGLWCSQESPREGKAMRRPKGKTVRLVSRGRSGRWFETVYDAWKVAKTGDTIEVYGKPRRSYKPRIKRSPARCGALRKDPKWSKKDANPHRCGRLKGHKGRCRCFIDRYGHRCGVSL